MWKRKLLHQEEIAASYYSFTHTEWHQCQVALLKQEERNMAFSTPDGEERMVATVEISLLDLCGPKPCEGEDSRSCQLPGHMKVCL